MPKPNHLLILLVLMVGCSSAQENALTQRGKALTLYNKGQYPQAIRHLKSAQTLLPAQRNTYWLGRIYYETGNYPIAIEYLEQLPSPGFYLAYAYYYNNQPNEAQVVCRQIIETGYNATNQQDWIETIKLCLKMQTRDLIIKAKLSELRSSPENPILQTQMAKLYQENNQPEVAKVYALKAIRLNPDEPSTLSLLGKIYTAEKEYDQAIIYFEKYLQINNKI